MRKVLITAVGGDVGGGILRCMKEAFPGDVFWGCDIKPEVPFLTLLDRYEIVPRSNTTQYRDKIMELCRDNGITHFCPTTEEEIILWDGLRDFFERHKIALMINKSDLIRIATSKYKTSEFLNQHGIVSPKTYLLDAYNGQLAFPVLKQHRLSFLPFRLHLCLQKVPDTKLSVFAVRRLSSSLSSVQCQILAPQSVAFSSR